MKFTESYKTFSHDHPWRAIVVVILFSLVALLSLIRICLPFAINYGVISWFESQNVKASISDINVSLLDGRFSIINFSGINNNQKGFSIERINITWQWWPLFDRQIIVDEIEIENLKADAELYSNGDKNIAGIFIKTTNTKSQIKEVEQTSENPWDITFKSIALSDINLCLQNFSENNKVIVDYVTLAINPRLI